MEDENIKKLYKEENVDIKKLISYLKCPICQGILRSPYTINECMHTFCKKCIYKNFFCNPLKDTCPICSTKLGGKPIETLIYDHSIAVLIEILFPEFEEIDREAEKKIFQVFREAKQALPGDEEFIKNQKPNVKIHMYPFKGEFHDNQLQKLSSPQLLLQSSINIESLKKYLIKKLDLTMRIDDISILYKNQDLKNEYTLKDIERIFGDFSNSEKVIFNYSKAIYASHTSTPHTPTKTININGKNGKSTKDMNNDLSDTPKNELNN